MRSTKAMKCISIDNVSVVLTQHPQIQKKSQYIKYLCCDDVRTLHQWVNGIRIAKVIFCFGVNVYNVICMYSMCIMLGFVAESVISNAVWEAAVCELPGSYETHRGCS